MALQLGRFIFVRFILTYSPQEKGNFLINNSYQINLVIKEVILYEPPAEMKGTRLKRVCIFILLVFSVELQLTVLGEETAYTCDSPTCSQDGEYFGDEGNCS